MTNRLSHIAFPLLLMLPFLVILAQVDFDSPQGPGFLVQWLAVLGNSIFQAGLSALLACALGFVFSYGLLAFSTHSKARQLLQVLYLLPALVPPITVVTSVLRGADLLGYDFEGLGAVVLTHGLMNAGLVAVSFDSAIRGRLRELLSSAEVLGASSWQITIRVLLPLLSGQISSLFVLVLGFCMLSLVVPLLLAPTQVWSVEVLIYSSIRANQQLDVAVWISLLQVALVFLFMAAVTKQPYRLNSARPVERLPLGHRFFCFPLALFSIGLLILPVAEVIQVSGLMRESEGLFFGEWASALLKSAIVLILTVLISFVLIVWLLYLSPRRRLHLFLNSSVAMSPVVVGFGYWMLGANFSPVSELKMALAISLFLRSFDLHSR
ncbi:MAG: ABC transporter permease subunit, partial [Pseudomonadota bacterium]